MRRASLLGWIDASPELPMTGLMALPGLVSPRGAVNPEPGSYIYIYIYIYSIYVHTYPYIGLALKF